MSLYQLSADPLCEQLLKWWDSTATFQVPCSFCKFLMFANEVIHIFCCLYITTNKTLHFNIFVHLLPLDAAKATHSASVEEQEWLLLRC